MPYITGRRKVHAVLLLLYAKLYISICALYANKSPLGQAWLILPSCVEIDQDPYTLLRSQCIFQFPDRKGGRGAEYWQYTLNLILARFSADYQEFLLDLQS